ncbi:hypothetical protein HRbin37_00894 [bacterium HR37]|nr:hypothetical protein HRbin37_00894 [bacterium HR37]
MIDFQEEIRNIARGRKQANNYSSGVSSKSPMKDVMEYFYNLAEQGVSIYNEALTVGELSVHRLPGEVLSLFLNLPRERMGFCVVAPESFVVFLEEDEEHVLVLGRRKQWFVLEDSPLSRARQLIRIRCFMDGGGFVFKDNTGTALDPEEIITLIIRWAVSER